MKYCRFCGDAMTATSTGPAKNRVTTWACSGGCSQETARIPANSEQGSAVLNGGDSIFETGPTGCYRTKPAPGAE